MLPVGSLRTSLPHRDREQPAVRHVAGGYSSLCQNFRNLTIDHVLRRRTAAPWQRGLATGLCRTDGLQAAAHRRFLFPAHALSPSQFLTPSAPIPKPSALSRPRSPCGATAPRGSAAPSSVATVGTGSSADHAAIPSAAPTPSTPSSLTFSDPLLTAATGPPPAQAVECGPGPLTNAAAADADTADAATPGAASEPAPAKGTAPPAGAAGPLNRGVYVDDEIGAALRAAAAQRARLAAALSGGGMRVVIDCGFGHTLASHKELRSLAKQVQSAVGHNRRSEAPVCLQVTSWCGELAGFAEARMGAAAWPLLKHSRSTLEIYDARDIVVLSPDADEPLLALDERRVYVIGGIVDRTVLPGVTAGFATAHSLEARRLPTLEYAEHLGLGPGVTKRPVLNICDVLLALLRFRTNGGDWRDALDAAIPRRKRSPPGAAAAAAVTGSSVIRGAAAGEGGSSNGSSGGGEIRSATV